MFGHIFIPLVVFTYARPLLPNSLRYILERVF